MWGDTCATVPPVETQTSERCRCDHLLPGSAALHPGGSRPLHKLSGPMAPRRSRALPVLWLLVSCGAMP